MNTIAVKCRHNDIEIKVLEKITPTPRDRERLELVARKAITLIKEFTRSRELDALVTIEGSYAKDTWLRDDVDLDLFILLPKDECIDVIEGGLIDKLTEWLLERGYIVQHRYAQHPYLRVLLDNTWIEVVPGCNVSDPSKPITPVDRTPFHRQYVVTHTTVEQRNEIRLLKSFLKGVGVYGAEIAVQGFSGYLAELLIIKYKCFRNLLREASERWRPRMLITLEKTSEENLSRLKKLYQDRPLIVVDPVDPGRNVAAALSYKSFATFIAAARLYLRSPSLTFFHVYSRVDKPLSPGSIPATAGGRIENVITIVLASKEPESPDNFWGVAQRLARLLEKMLVNNDFRVLDRSVYVNENGTRAIIALELESRKIPTYKLHYGPPAWSRENAEKFLEKHLASESIGPWVDESGRLVVIKRRSYTDALDAVKSLAPRWVPKSAKKYEIRVTTLIDIIDKLSREELAWLRRFIVKRPTWMNTYR